MNEQTNPEMPLDEVMGTDPDSSAHREAQPQGSTTSGSVPGVEGHHERGMDEVQQVGHRRPQALDLQRVDALDGLDHGLGRVAAVAGVQQPGEGLLVRGVLVDVGDAQLPRRPRPG